jgi:hypothetical protein
MAWRQRAGAVRIVPGARKHRRFTELKRLYLFWRNCGGVAAWNFMRQSKPERYRTGQNISLLTWTAGIVHLAKYAGAPICGVTSDSGAGTGAFFTSSVSAGFFMPVPGHHSKQGLQMATGRKRLSWTLSFHMQSATDNICSTERENKISSPSIC